MLNIEEDIACSKQKLDVFYEIPGLNNYYLDVRNTQRCKMNLLKELCNLRGSNYFANINRFNIFKGKPSLDNAEGFKISGGIFADEMGLGKTISLIALILSNPCKSIPKLENSSHLHFGTKATLVICIPHLIEQWFKEFKKCSTLSIIKIRDVNNIKKISYRKLISADVVIVSCNLLTSSIVYSARYSEDINNPSKPTLDTSYPLFHHIHWYRIIADEAHEVKWTGPAWTLFRSTYRWYVSGTPFPKKMDSFLNALSFLNVKYDSIDLFELLQYYKEEDYAPLQIQLWNCFKDFGYWRNTKSDVSEEIDIPGVSERVEYIELTKEEQLIYESLTYGTNIESNLRKMCSYPWDLIYSKEYRFQRRNYRRGANNQIDSTKNNILNRYKVYQLPYYLIFETIEEVNNSVSKHITISSRRNIVLNDWRKTNTDRKNEVDRLEKRLDTIKSEIEMYCKKLPILLECINNDTTNNTEKQDLCFTCKNPIKCYFRTYCCKKRTKLRCFLCLTNFIIENQKCPYCKTRCLSSVQNITLHPKYELSKKIREYEIIEKPKEDDKFTSIIQSHGSKMACIIDYLYSLVTSNEVKKIIVFSQYDKMLKGLQETLENYDDIFKNQITSCTGNVYIRKIALDKFNSKDPKSPRILMLSLKHSASGTQLEIASQILILDPVVGSDSEVRATDAQAIARSHRIGQERPVEAVRFIISQTIEQEDYEKVYGRRSRQKSARK